MAEEKTFVKALSEGSDSAGGYMVPEEYLPKLIELIRNNTIVEQIAQRIPMQRDVLKIPTQTAGATAYWVGENAAITASDQTFGTVTLTAHKIASLTKVSSELYEDAKVVPEISAIIMDDLAKQIGIELDRVYINGDSSGSDPFDGLVNLAGNEVAASGDNGDKITFDKFIDAVKLLQEDNFDPNSRRDAYWIVNPRDLAEIRKLKDTTDNYIWQPALDKDSPATIYGIPYKVSNQIPKNLTVGTSTDASYILLVLGDEILIGDRRDYRIETSAEAGDAFEYDQVWFKVTARKAFAVRHANAICKITGITPSGA